MDLFDYSMEERMRQEAPLAARMRPVSLTEIIGQEHILGEGRLLRRAIAADRLFSSIILWGPPGTGKTTLARVIALSTKSHFETISAVLAGVAELRRVIAEAQERRKLFNTRTILFVDEVHRWNKAQQDALLPHVESGVLTLIGATTENPYFEVIKALVSRSRVFELKPLSDEQVGEVLQRALKDEERGLGKLQVKLWDDAFNHFRHMANGDARNALNALELAVYSTPPDALGNIQVTLDVAQESIQQRAVLYDKDGDAHYDTISAFIKSVRGSDPDAALFWLAKMVQAGEDPRFIARRLVILAAEDVGLAEPLALMVATAALQAVQNIGLPEAVYPMAEAAIFLATAPKSNSTGAYFKALELIQKDGVGAVPAHLMDASRDGPALGHGKGYQYPHQFPGHYVAQQYLPDKYQGVRFYEPSDEGYEKGIRERMDQLRAAALRAASDNDLKMK